MSGDNVRNGAVMLKKGSELVEFLLEDAEMEYINVDTKDGMFIELANGITFLFDDNDELVDICNN